MPTELPYALGLPTTWNEVALDDVASDSDLWRRLAAEIPAGVGLDGVDADEVSRTMSWWIRQARKRGLALAASYGEVIDFTEDGELQQVGLAAVMTLAFVHRSTFGIDELQTLNPGVIIAALERSAEPNWEPLAAPERIDLVCGEAVERLRTAVHDDDRVFEATYYIPVADGEVLAVASFVTPSVFASDSFLELFRQIVDTLEVLD